MEANDNTKPDSLDISNSEAEMIKVSLKDVDDDDTLDNEDCNDESEDETIEAIMSKAMAFSFEELNDEDEDETIDAIMAKARAFKDSDQIETESKSLNCILEKSLSVRYKSWSKMTARAR
jgi:glutamyl-tRNA reductase